MHHPVADRRQLGRVEAQALGGQFVGDLFEGRRVVGDGPLTDPLHDAGGGPGAVGHVQKLVLHGRGAGVEDEDSGAVHADWAFSVGDAGDAGDWAWMAVIETVLTMSWTSAPRDRSFTGLRRPCRTGPTATAPAERCTAL